MPGIAARRRSCTTPPCRLGSTTACPRVWRSRAVGSPDLVHAVQSAFVHGMSLMLLVGAVMSAVLAIVAATVLRRGSTGRHRTRRGQQAVINQRQDERQSVYAGR